MTEMQTDAEFAVEMFHMEGIANLLLEDDSRYVDSDAGVIRALTALPEPRFNDVLTCRWPSWAEQSFADYWESI